MPNMNDRMELEILRKAEAGGWKPPWAADSPFAILGPQWLGENKKRKAVLEKMFNTDYVDPDAAAVPVKPVASPTPYFKPAVTPAGNNIASSAFIPNKSGTTTLPNLNTALSGTNLSTVSPNSGTLGTGINQSPFSPMAGTRKKTSPNKYFNQSRFDERWFGTKQLA